MEGASSGRKCVYRFWAADTTIDHAWPGFLINRRERREPEKRETPRKMVSLWAKSVKNADLAHCGQQHLYAMPMAWLSHKWALHEKYRPKLYVAMEALGSFPTVAVSCPIAMTLYIYMLLP